MATIDEYFARNGIVPKSDEDITSEQRRVSRILHETEFFNQYFQTCLDVFMVGIDYYLNRVQFDLVLSESRKFSDFFQPCCQSGILGCFIALETKGRFKGIDINPFGINRAKERAKMNGLDPDIFELWDITKYQREHEAVVGRYVLNTPELGIDDEAVDAVSRISKNLVLIQNTQPHELRAAIECYRVALERHGYSFEVISKPMLSNSTGAYEFVVRATKNST